MSSRKPLSKGEKSLFLLSGLVIVPLAASAFLFGARDAEPKWNIPLAAKRPVPNGYDSYVAAAKATVRFNPEVDAASDVHAQPPGSAYALQNYSLARRNQWLLANGQAFSLLNQGLLTPSMAPDNPNGMNRDWGRLRQLARDIGARSRTFQMAHQPMRATMSSLDGMQMAQDAARGGDLLARLVGISIVAISRSPLDDFDKTINALSADEARVAARRLELLLAHEPTTTQTLTEERRVDTFQLRQLLSTPNWRNTFAPNGFFSGGLGQTWGRQTISKRTIYDHFTLVEDAVIANSKLPYSKAQVATVPSNLDIFSNEFGSAANRAFQNEARNSTSNNMLLLRLALRSYIAQHKSAPPTLNALVPNILKSIPNDVYNDGKPLFYKPSGATYKLWSVGPDGKNDGGVPFPPRGAAAAKFPVSNTSDNKGDFVAGLCR